MNIVSDWNGTSFEDTDEGKLWMYVGLDYLKASLWNPVKTAGKVSTMLELKDLTKKCKEGKIGYDKIYETFNEKVLRNLPPSFVLSSIDDYSKKEKTLRKLDDRILRPIADARNNGARTGILSTGCGYGISRILEESEHGHVFDHIIANNIKPRYDGRTEFLLTIYKNKEEFLDKRFVREFGFNPKEMVYIGDSNEDENCMSYVSSEGGKIIIPFFATDDFKQWCRTKYNAFVPEKEEDFSNYLKSIRQSQVSY